MKFFIAIRALVFALTFVAVFITPATARAMELEDTGVLLALELKSLSQSVDRLAALLKKQASSSTTDAELRKLEIAIAYLNFRSRRIEMFERDLQNMRTQRNRLEDIFEQFQREEDNYTRSFDGNDQDALQRAKEELRFRRQSLKDRIDRMDEEMIMLENRILDMQSQIDSVESFVEKNLVF